MATTTAIIVDLTLLLATSVLAGEIANRLGQAALVGQLIVGVVLGPSLLGPLIGLASLPPELTTVQVLATVFILFLAGLEVVPEQLFRMGWKNLAFGVLAFVVPFGAISGVTWVLFPTYARMTVLFIALTLSITALPVMGIMLTEFGLLRSKYGRLLMNTALINELVAVSTFAVLDQIQSSPAAGWISVAIAILSVAVFLGAMLAIHQAVRALRTVHRWEQIRTGFARTWRSRSGGFALLMIMVLGTSLFSQYLGLTFVVGAFYAGLLVTEETAGAEAHRSISTIFDTMSWGFFVPLFFAVVGLQMNLRDLASAWDVLLLILLFGVAFLSKASTGYVAGRALGWGDANAMSIGYLISSRGAVELAMAVILLDAKIFTVTTFTLVAAVGLLTTIVAPIGAIRSWESDPVTRKELYERLPVLRPGAQRSRAFRRSFPFGPLSEFDALRASRNGRDPLPSVPGGSPAPAGDPPPPTAAPEPAGPEPERPPLPRRRRPDEPGGPARP